MRRFQTQHLPEIAHLVVAEDDILARFSAIPEQTNQKGRKVYLADKRGVCTHALYRQCSILSEWMKPSQMPIWHVNVAVRLRRPQISRIRLAIARKDMERLVRGKVLEVRYNGLLPDSGRFLWLLYKIDNY